MHRDLQERARIPHNGKMLLERGDLLGNLRRHRPFDAHEAAMLERIIAFVESHDDCFERSQAAGHVTGSAWVIDRARTHTLMVHHRRLNKWLQPGGHCDGDADVLAVALREVEEETGLRAEPVSDEIFDVDTHSIPARKNEPAHIHYDIRYLVVADRSLEPIVSPESRAVAWVSLRKVSHLNPERSITRMVARLGARE